jgi:uncharacterized phiE125 gp8 family phage protein
VSTIILGTGVDVLNKSSIVQISVGTVTGSATLDCKIQESNDNNIWNDWTGGSLTQITASGTYEKQYTGIKKYIRVHATTSINKVKFSASIITKSYLTDEDTCLTTLIKTARQICEDHQRRSYINRTYKYYLDEFPCSSEQEIVLPNPPVSSITTIKYTNTDGTQYTWSSSEYQIDSYGFTCRLKPKYGYEWPSDTLQEMSGVEITYVAGYGATASTVPEKIRHAIMILCGELYENREDSDSVQKYNISWGVKALLGQDRVIEI